MNNTKHVMSEYNLIYISNLHTSLHMHVYTHTQQLSKIWVDGKWVMRSM